MSDRTKHPLRTKTLEKLEGSVSLCMCEGKPDIHDEYPRLGRSIIEAGFNNGWIGSSDSKIGYRNTSDEVSRLVLVTRTQPWLVSPFNEATHLLACSPIRLGSL